MAGYLEGDLCCAMLVGHGGTSVFITKSKRKGVRCQRYKMARGTRWIDVEGYVMRVRWCREIPEVVGGTLWRR